MNYYQDQLTALQSKEYAQIIAFAPVVFQAARSMRNLGLLSFIENNASTGAAFNDVMSATGLSEYAARVLLEAGLGIGLLRVENEKYYLTKTASFILNDEMTIANMDFVHDVCYKGMFELERSLQTGRPEGLKTFGEWNTVYEALSSLPENIQKSWFAFDHYYSDLCFPQVLPLIFRNNPSTLLDIGGNTGKWAKMCLDYNPAVHVTIADLPGQLEMVRKNITKPDMRNRLHLHEVNLLHENASLPAGFDAIWMSQFLDCFSENEIITILHACAKALSENGSIYILEPFWDAQKFRISAFCLQMTSLYFTNIANGNSRMYHSEIFTSLLDKAGLIVKERIDQIGISHTLLRCTLKHSEI